MPIYEMKSDQFEKLDETSFAEKGIEERNDLQRLLRDDISIISPDTLVISEEFGEWEGSKRRIDLLGLDKAANLVVIELKRTEDGGHMELQAIRYAAMVSTLTFEKAVEIYGKHLKKRESEKDARQEILEFLDWNEDEIEDKFAQDVRIILASAEFSKELTTAVMWLNDRDIDIRCVRLKPYEDGDRLLVDVQQIIPLPEIEQYQVQLREKVITERETRKQSRDYTKFDITIDGDTESWVTKGRAIFKVVSHLCKSGVSPEQIEEVLPARLFGRSFESAEGALKSEAFIEAVSARRISEGKHFAAGRFFKKDEELIHYGEKTYAFSTQWGKPTEEALELLTTAFPDVEFQCTKSVNNS